VFIKPDLIDAPARPDLTGKGYFEFIPLFKASVFPSAAPVTFNTSCFLNYSAQMLTFTDAGATLSVSARHKRSLFCHDSMVVASRSSVHFFDFLFEDTFDARFQWSDPSEVLDIKENGFQVFYLPDGYIGSLLDIWQTYQLVTSVNSFQDGINVMKENMNITFTDRTAPYFIPDESEIMDGDYIAIFGISNTSTSHNVATSVLISLGTGGHTSHVAICLWVDDQLYVMEANDKGVIKTPYRQWMRELGPEFMAAILRLREDLQAKFNNTAALEYFKTIEGLPYGMENFVFGWIDTPDDNYPSPLDSSEVPGVMILGSVFFPDAVKLGLLEGINKRLHTIDLSASEILEFCDKKNLSLVDVIALPELESFTYPNPTGPRMVCDVFALKMYRAAGIFGNLLFEATELTPKDSYQLQIFSTNWKRPQACAGDPTPGLCQISGMYWITLPGFNSIPPYEHMNEKCGALPPYYVRAPVGC